MKLKINAEELCTICVMGWHGPLPPFKGVQGILPYGVKNVIKWKSRIGLKKLVHNQYEKLKKEKIWGTKEYNRMVMAILFYKQAYTFANSQNCCITFYEGTENNFVSICIIDNDEYEIVNYPNLEKWINTIYQTFHEMTENTNLESISVIHHRWGTDKKEIQEIFNAVDWDIKMVIQKCILESVKIEK